MVCCCRYSGADITGFTPNTSVTQNISLTRPSSSQSDQQQENDQGGSGRGSDLYRSNSPSKSYPFMAGHIQC